MILLRRVSKDLIATISENPIAFSKNLYGLKISKIDVKFVLALLNSKLLNFYYKKKFSTKKEDVFPEIQTYFVEQLPIKIPKNQLPIITLVEDILSAKSKGAETAALAAKIDVLVYKLYDLNY